MTKKVKIKYITSKLIEGKLNGGGIATKIMGEKGRILKIIARRTNYKIRWQNKSKYMSNHDMCKLIRILSLKLSS